MSRNVEITPLEFSCKNSGCKGKAHYTWETVVGLVRRRDHSPRILGKLTRVRVHCDATTQHGNTFRVAFFKCREDPRNGVICDQYVMGTSEEGCTDRKRIFQGGKATLECINGHSNVYQLVQ